MGSNCDAHSPAEEVGGPRAGWLGGCVGWRVCSGGVTENKQDGPFGDYSEQLFNRVFLHAGWTLLSPRGGGLC